MPFVECRRTGSQVFRLENGHNFEAKARLAFGQNVINQALGMARALDPPSVAVDISQDADITRGRLDLRLGCVISRVDALQRAVSRPHQAYACILTFSYTLGRRP